MPPKRGRTGENSRQLNDLTSNQPRVKTIETPSGRSYPLSNAYRSRWSIAAFRVLPHGTRLPAGTAGTRPSLSADPPCGRLRPAIAPRDTPLP